MAGFVCAVAAVVWFAVAAERAAATRAFEKFEAADSMLAAALARDTALRGYLQTTNESFVAEYNSASAALAEAADIARKHARGRAAELERIAAQERVAERWAESADGAIDGVRATRNIRSDSSAVRSELLAGFRGHNDELRDLIQEQADDAHAAVLRQTVVLTALVSAAFAAIAAFLLTRLRRDEHERQEAEQSYVRTQREFAEMLQVTETEVEAHALVKRHLERTLPASEVVVLNRNTSRNRLEATTPVDPASALADRLIDSMPNSCLAVRLGRTHVRSHQHEPLLECTLCGPERRSTCVPSLVGGQVIGSVLVTHDDVLEPRDHTRIEESVSQAAPVLANLRNLAVAEVRAATDALTGLPNARSLRETLKRMLAQAARSELPLSAILADLDNFKQVNDVYGHDKGDQVLAAASAVMRSAMRESDVVGRYGGEEFLILLPDTPSDGARVVAEKLCQKLMLVEIPGVDRSVSGSFGVATYPTDAPDGEMLLRMADRALYAAKGAGRNCVISSAELVGSPAS